MRIVKVRALRYALITGFLFSCHLALVSYVNSSFAANLFGEDAVGPLYSIASFIALFALLFWAPKRVARHGTLLFVAALLLIALVSLTGLSQAHYHIGYAILFVIYLSHNAIIWFGLDMIVEHATENADTGRIRGIYLTVVNLAWMLAMLGTGTIIEAGGFGLLYLAAATLVFLSLLAISRGGMILNTNKISPVRLKDAARRIFGSKNLSSIFLVNFSLQIFYAIMVIFTPIYLSSVIGFGWREISVIFFVMLSPFVILQYPLGRIADMRFGEKEILIFGLSVMGLSTLGLVTINQPSIWIWAAMLLATRVGAATVEVMAESYFFKHVEVKDASLVGAYRALSPLALVIVPVLASLVISGSGYSTLFSLLGLICLLAIIPALRIKDTR